MNPDGADQQPDAGGSAGPHIFHAQDGRLRAGWRFCLGALIFVASELLASAAASFVPHHHPLVYELVYRSVSLAILLGGFAFLLLTVDQVEERPLASMGLAREPRSRRLAASGIATGATMVTVCAAVIFTAGGNTVHVTASFRSVSHAALALVVLAVAAMAEESVFRGYPFQRLVEATGPVVAIVIMSAFFGFVHGDNPNVSRWAIANTILFGVLLAVAYLRSRSLWLPWGLHFGWNALLAVGFGLPMSGLTMFALVVRTRAAGPRWITGGDYGIEGSALATIIISAAIPVTCWIGSRRGLRAEPFPGQLPQESGVEHVPDDGRI